MVKCEETLLLSTSPGKDSGFESSEDADTGLSPPPLAPMTAEQLSKVRQQLEFYLSDEVVSKDQFLLKHVTKSKEGWLSLKLMASFRKVKGLCKGYDWRIVAEALRDSEFLEVNSDGSKMRRRCAAPEDDETKPARTVIVWSSSQDITVQGLINTEHLEKVFGKCGSIQSCRLITPGEEVEDAARRAFVRHPKIRQLTCAIIEFDRSEAAANAATLTDIHLQMLLLKDCFKPGPPGREPKKTTRDRRAFSDSEALKPRSAAGGPTTNPTVIKESSRLPDAPLSWRDRSQPIENKPRAKSFCAGTETTKQQQPKNKDQTRQTRSKDSSESSLLTVPKEGETRPRRFTFSDTSAATICVIRQPRGPDGTRGFHQQPAVLLAAA